MGRKWVAGVRDEGVLKPGFAFFEPAASIHSFAVSRELLDEMDGDVSLACVTRRERDDGPQRTEA
jgi:hypothetical protein